MYFWKPVDKDIMSAIPIIPMDPANAVKIVRPFLVRRLLKLNASAQKSEKFYPLSIAINPNMC
jgi:hypothetical protein